MVINKLVVFGCFFVFCNTLYAHGGGVDSNECHIQKSTKDARDIELADSKKRHRKFCRGIPDVLSTARPHMMPTANHVETEKIN